MQSGYRPQNSGRLQSALLEVGVQEAICARLGAAQAACTSMMERGAVCCTSWHNAGY